MGRSQRTRGASFEREITKILAEAVGHPVQRILGQARDGGADVEVGAFLFECKRRRSLKTVYDWVHQVTLAVGTALIRRGKKRIGVVILRTDFDEPLVIMRMEDWLATVNKELLKEGDAP
jgi:Holliday junction resolvase